MTVNEAFEIHVTERELRPATLTGYRDQMDRYLRKVRSRAVADLTRQDTRDAAHLADGIDPNIQDATLVISVLDWVLAEFVRIYHGVPAQAAQVIIESLSSREELAPRPQPIHARSETIDTTKAFAQAFADGQRGVVVFKTFNEGGKSPPAAGSQRRCNGPSTRKMRIPRGFAFVWKRFEIMSSAPMVACVMATVPASRLVHARSWRTREDPRMPAILEDADWDTWLGQADATPEQAKAVFENDGKRELENRVREKGAAIKASEIGRAKNATRSAIGILLSDHIDAKKKGVRRIIQHSCNQS